MTTRLLVTLMSLISIVVVIGLMVLTNCSHHTFGLLKAEIFNVTKGAEPLHDVTFVIESRHHVNMCNSSQCEKGISLITTRKSDVLLSATTTDGQVYRMEFTAHELQSKMDHVFWYQISSVLKARMRFSFTLCNRRNDCE
jgi:hypothetical protein